MNSSRSTDQQGGGSDSQCIEEFLTPLRSVFSWILSHEDAQGRLICKEHKVEHTGKSACAIILALELREHDERADRAALLAFAVRQARSLSHNLKREGTSPCHTFRPGRHDPFNCSNSVIDGGACCDALSQLLLEAEDELEAEDAEAFRYACELHARTYLRYAVVDKGIPAQRAWGMTGLAGALALDPTDSGMQSAAVQAIDELRQIQHEDGSYPYHPSGWGGSHPGSGDVSSFYQSRVTGFLLFAMERMGLDPRHEDLREPLLTGIRFLNALQGPDGIKVGLVEAKPWYWGATYEVASHPFDVFTLARAHALFSPEHDPRGYARSAASGAIRAFRAWADHLDADGKPASHHAGPGRGRSYQCPMFWATHAAWMARALPDLGKCLEVEAAERREQKAREALGDDRALDLSVAFFPGAQLVRLEDGRVVAWIRGARPGVNVHHGSPHGAGLLRCVRVSDGSDLIGRCRLGGAQPGEWSGRSGSTSIRRGWNSGKRELRFSWWLARVHWRAGRWLDAMLQPLRTFRRGIAAFAHPRVSSAFDLQPQLQLLPDGVCLTSKLAHRDGSRPASTVELERVFRVDGAGLDVFERRRGGADTRSLHFEFPKNASEVEEKDCGGEPVSEIRYRLS